MKKHITEEQIQEALEMLRKSNPEATREEAIKTVETMQKMAGMLLDKVGDDLDSGKIEISENGRITRADSAEEDENLEG